MKWCSVAVREDASSDAKPETEDGELGKMKWRDDPFNFK